MSDPEGTFFVTSANSIMATSRKALLCFFAVFALSCGGQTVAPSNQVPSEPAQVSPQSATPESLPKIVAFGDSLTAGFGLSERDAYPALLQEKLKADGLSFEVVNAGVSGDRSIDGVRRIDWALDGDVRIVILELGANDLLRGMSIPEMKKNLAQIIERCRARGADVLLAGMIAPTNAGREYQEESVKAFRSLAAEHKTPMIPFLLEGVAGVESLNQADGIHPNREGARFVAETVYKYLKPMAEQAEKRRPKSPGSAAQQAPFMRQGARD